jgi:hypothetical protein
MSYLMVPLRCGRLRIEKTNYACYLIIIWNVFWFAIRTIPRSLPIIFLHSFTTPRSRLLRSQNGRPVPLSQGVGQ